MERIVEAASALRQELADCDPAALSGSHALELVEVLASVEKVCAAARARAAARVDECEAYRLEGHRSGAEWLARTLGTSPRQAATSIETARVVEGLAATREAFAAGCISEAQAAELAKAAAVDPSAEADLIDIAVRDDWRSLKDRVRRVRLNTEVDREALRERQHRAREFHHWIDDEGMVAGRFRLPPEVGAPLVNRIDAQTDREYRHAWQQGGRESRGAYAADALVKLLSRRGMGARRGPRWWWWSTSRPYSAATSRGGAVSHPRRRPAAGACRSAHSRRCLPERRAGRWVRDSQGEAFRPLHPGRAPHRPRTGAAARTGRGGVRRGGLRTARRAGMGPYPAGVTPRPDRIRQPETPLPRPPP